MNGEPSPTRSTQMFRDLDAQPPSMATGTIAASRTPFPMVPRRRARARRCISSPLRSRLASSTGSKAVHASDTLDVSTHWQARMLGIAQN